jgi:flagellar hook assembly protein FlgD
MNSNAVFQYYLAEDSHVNLELYNSKGQSVMQLAHGSQLKGEHNVQWNADGLPAGIYYYSLRSGKQVHTGKIVIIK